MRRLPPSERQEGRGDPCRGNRRERLVGVPVPPPLDLDVRDRRERVSDTQKRRDLTKRGKKEQKVSDFLARGIKQAEGEERKLTFCPRFTTMVTSFGVDLGEPRPAELEVLE